MISLITASLFSNTYNKASRFADWTFHGTKSMSCTTSILLWDLFFSFTGCPVRSETWKIFPKTETIRSHNSRANKPSSLNPVSREIISDSVELWETDVCFLHIQLIGTNVWLPKTHNVPQVIRSVVLTLPVVYNRPTSTVNDISVTKICWILESHSSEVFDKRLWMRVITSLSCLIFLVFLRILKQNTKTK